MTTDKPEVVAWRWREPVVNDQGETIGATAWELSDAPGFCRWWTNEPLIRLSDYNTLQAENEKLRKDAERLDWIVSEGAIVARAGVRGEPLRYWVEWPMLGEVDNNWFTSERDAIDAAMQETSHEPK